MPVPEIREELRKIADLRNVGVQVLTLGQYLRPSAHHLPVARWWTPAEFAEVGEYAEPEAVAAASLASKPAPEKPAPGARPVRPTASRTGRPSGKRNTRRR